MFQKQMEYADEQLAAPVDYPSAAGSFLDARQSQDPHHMSTAIIWMLLRYSIKLREWAIPNDIMYYIAVCYHQTDPMYITECNNDVYVLLHNKIHVIVINDADRHTMADSPSEIVQTFHLPGQCRAFAATTNRIAVVASRADRNNARARDTMYSIWYNVSQGLNPDAAFTRVGDDSAYERIVSICATNSHIYAVVQLSCRPEDVPREDRLAISLRVRALGGRTRDDLLANEQTGRILRERGYYHAFVVISFNNATFETLLIGADITATCDHTNISVLIDGTFLRCNHSANFAVNNTYTHPSKFVSMDDIGRDLVVCDGDGKYYKLSQLPWMTTISRPLDIKTALNVIITNISANTHDRDDPNEQVIFVGRGPAPVLASTKAIYLFVRNYNTFSEVAAKKIVVVCHWRQLGVL